MGIPSAVLGSRQLGLSISLALALLLMVTSVPISSGLTFKLEKVECFTETVGREQSTMVGFVVSKQAGALPHGDGSHSIDVKVTDPQGNIVAQATRKSADDLFFWHPDGGDFKICFYNLAHGLATVSFDVSEYYQYQNKKEGDKVVVKAEDVDELHREMNTLRSALESTHHDAWYSFFLAQQHIEMDEELGRRLVVRTVFQACLLIACSVAQVIILQRLFERRMSRSKV